MTGSLGVPLGTAGLALVLGAATQSAAGQAPATPTGTWDAAAAAEYLDGRQAWWLDWSVAQRDRGTVCQSCHTTVPYALARPALRGVLGETGSTIAEGRLLSDVRTRVSLWDEIEPFYPDQTVGLPKTSESRGTEAVLNALVLANRDAGGGILSDEARQAFDHLWALQFRRGELTGAWAWLYFDLAPWESDGAAYFGAALAAVAVGIAPGGYATSADAQEPLGQLRAYLLDGWETRSAFDRAMLLWAASELPGLLAPDEGLSIVEGLTALQRADGGWSLTSLGPWTGREGYAPDAASDGYATGLVAFVLQRAGVARRHEGVARALTWLERNQHASGRWPATSLNRARDPESERGLMMADVATAFAVLALTESERASWR